MSLFSSNNRRTVQRDDRRRRLLADDIYGDQSAISWPASADSSSAVGKRGRYGDDFCLEGTMLLADLVPRRLTTIVLMSAAAIGAIAWLDFLHDWQLRFSAANSGVQLSALDLARYGSLGSWFSGLLLLAAAVTAFLVYSIRRHRTDDYHGRYRVWLWASLCWFLAAADVASNLHDVLRQIMMHLAKTRIFGDGTLWWIIPYAIVFGALGSRLVLDMWPCRLAIGAFVLAGAGYLLSAAMTLGWVVVEDPIRSVIIGASAAMAGHLMLLLSMALNARFVIFDAEGLLPVSEQFNNPHATAGAGANSSGAAGSQWTRVDSPAGAAQPASRRAASSSTSSTTPEKPGLSATPAVPASVTRKLTKQEKKALRERLLRERMERERRFRG